MKILFFLFKIEFLRHVNFKDEDIRDFLDQDDIDDNDVYQRTENLLNLENVKTHFYRIKEIRRNRITKNNFSNRNREVIAKNRFKHY